MLDLEKERKGQRASDRRTNETKETERFGVIQSEASIGVNLTPGTKTE